MKLKIDLSAIIQYILIYLMFVCNNSVLYQYLFNDNKKMYIVVAGIIDLIGIFIIFYKRKRYYNFSVAIYIICMVLFFLLNFIRWNEIGGVYLMQLLGEVLLTYTAFAFSKQNFLKRYIKLVCCFSAISLIFYAIQLINPSILEKVLIHYMSNYGFTEWNGYESVFYKNHAWGMIIYGFRYGEISRNLGVFTEPGNYQVVLNSALYLLLFFQNDVGLNKREYARTFLVLVVTIITCGSTSGYMISGTMLIAWGISHSKNEFNKILKKRVAITAFIGATCLGLQFFFFREVSFIYKNFVVKILNDKGNVDVNTGTGYWRMLTLNGDIEMMKNHPFGYGISNQLAYKASISKGATGAALFNFGAQFGIIALLFLITWMMLPVIKCKKISIASKVVFAFFFIDVGIAQTLVVFPAIVIISLFISNENKKLPQSDCAG